MELSDSETLLPSSSTSPLPSVSSFFSSMLCLLPPLLPSCFVFLPFYPTVSTSYESFYFSFVRPEGSSEERRCQNKHLGVGSVRSIMLKLSATIFANLIKILNPSHPWEKISSRGKTWHSFVAVVFLCEIYLYIKPWEMFQMWYISLYKILENFLTCEIYLIRTRIIPIWSIVFHLAAKIFYYDLNEAEDIGKR